MNIGFVAPELYPFSKTGGLADYAAALPAVLAKAGLSVTVFTPLHRSVLEWLNNKDISGHESAAHSKLQVGDEQHEARYFLINWHGLQIVFVANGYYFDRPHPYLDSNGRDYEDNAVRFAFFCKAVLSFYRLNGEKPDILHANDWQTALIPVYLRELDEYKTLKNAKSLLTIHNLGYQGLFKAPHLHALGLGTKLFHPESLEYYGKLNLLKGGIIFADHVNTVSPTYAEEIKTKKYGHGLEGVLAKYRNKLTGILSGIDCDEWNPAADPHLPAHYDASDLSGKRSCKAALQRAANLPIRPRCFLAAAISRFDKQKGIHLLAAAFDQVASLDLQLVILGDGHRELVEMARALACAYPEQVSLHIGFNESLAHLIEAGADTIIMPSLYEPCGLTQMYSQRYGTVPIVHETGGLKDTVQNYTPLRLRKGLASGFSFRQPSVNNLVDVVRAAARVYFSERRHWNKLVRSIMSIDHSWSQRATSYISLYEMMLHSKAAAGGISA